MMREMGECRISAPSPIHINRTSKNVQEGTWLWQNIHATFLLESEKKFFFFIADEEDSMQREIKA
jgi:hypothetical protein